MTATKRIDPFDSAMRGEARPGRSTRAPGPRGIGLALLALLAMVSLAGMAFGSTPSEATEALSEQEPATGAAGGAAVPGQQPGCGYRRHRRDTAHASTPIGRGSPRHSRRARRPAVTHWVPSTSRSPTSTNVSTVADHLQVTINAVAGGGGPGDAHCTLTNPSSFSTLGVSVFAAPTGAGSCPQLATGTTYFVVIEWVDPSGTGSFALIPQTYPTEESAATEEDPGGAEGWSIADQSHYLSASSNARTWTAYQNTASFKIVVKQAAEANSADTGLPTITGHGPGG